MRSNKISGTMSILRVRLFDEWSQPFHDSLVTNDQPDREEKQIDPSFGSKLSAIGYLHENSEYSCELQNLLLPYFCLKNFIKYEPDQRLRNSR